MNERDRRERAGTVRNDRNQRDTWRYLFPFFRAVLREATTIAASSFASCTRDSTSSDGTRRVSAKNSSQKADSSRPQIVWFVVLEGSLQN